MNSIEQRIAALEARIAQAESRIAQLERPRTVFGPITLPAIPDGWLYNGIPGTCATCGIKTDGPMGYVCPRGDCPTQPKCISQVSA